VVRNARIGILLTAILVFAASAHLNAAQFLFTPELTLSGTYSDNVFLTHTNEVEDYIIAAGLNLTAQILGRTSGLELVYNPTYSSFMDDSDLNYWRHAARLSVWNDFRRGTRLSLSNDYLETENPRDRSIDFAPDDPLEGPAIDVDLTRRGRTRYRRNITEARLNHQYGPRNSFYSAVSYSFLEDIDTVPERPVSDHQIWQPSVGLEHWFTRRWGFSVDGFYSHREYDARNDRQEITGTLSLLHAFSRNLSGYVAYRHTALKFDDDGFDNQIDDDYQIYYPSAGIRYQFDQDGYISIGVGYFSQNFDTRDDPEESVVIDSTLFKRWAYRTSRIEFTGGSGYRVADSGADDLGLNIYYQGRLDYVYNFTRRFATNAYAAYRYDDYPNAIPERTDNTIGAGAGVSYQALQWMNVGLTYNFRHRTSDILIEEYTENSVVLSFTMAPTRPYRWN